MQRGSASGPDRSDAVNPTALLLGTRDERLRSVPVDLRGRSRPAAVQWTGRDLRGETGIGSKCRKNRGIGQPRPPPSTGRRRGRGVTGRGLVNEKNDRWLSTHRSLYLCKKIVLLILYSEAINFIVKCGRGMFVHQPHLLHHRLLRRSPHSFCKCGCCFSNDRHVLVVPNKTKLVCHINASSHLLTTIGLLTGENLYVTDPILELTSYTRVSMMNNFYFM
jgi:hypothetical protein